MTILPKLANLEKLSRLKLVSLRAIACQQIHIRLLCSIFVALLIGLSAAPQAVFSATLADATTPIYQFQRPSPDGIGKFYFGREIAQVMGHLGAGWLERPSRETEEQPQRLVEVLDLKPEEVVAEIGAGTGYISFRLAQQVPNGKVLAVDIQPEMIEILKTLQQERQIQNVEPILGTATDPHLPAKSIDLVIMVDAYHEFEYPQEMMTALVQALKPQGRVALVEYRAENPFILIKQLHKMSQAQVKKEMRAVGLVWRETKSLLPQQHLMIFELAPGLSAT